MISNIWIHWKTTAVGILIAVGIVVGVLSQQGITLGHAGTGTVVALIGALATAILGALSRDPGNGTITTTTTKMFWGVLLAPLALALMGCPAAQRQQVAQALQTASTVVQSFQQAEIVSHNQGVVSDDDHHFIEQQLLTVAAAGKTADSCVQTTTTVAGDIACVNTMATMVDQVNTQGGLYIKSAQAKQDFQLAMTGLKAALATINAILGGPAPAAAATK
jgi:hypothetical protein